MKTFIKKHFPISRNVNFRRGIGRTDLWGGDSEAILASIRSRLFALPDSTPVICGHGPSTTIEEERVHNPFAAL